MRQLPRRRFVKGLFLGTAFSSIIGKSWSSLYAASYAPTSQAPTFQINISHYPALQEEFGSVRVGVSSVGGDFYPASRYWPILINRDPERFYVLDSECRHAGCVVGTFTPGQGIQCPCHGSIYSIGGEVEQGPAAFPLRTYDFTFDGTNTLTISVPSMAFHVRTFLPPAEPDARLQLEFTAEGGVTYEVLFREKLTHPWKPASFSRTPDGQAQEEPPFLGNGQSNTLYLDRTTPTGFYAVAMLLDQV